MKITELRSLIREEVRKVVNEQRTNEEVQNPMVYKKLASKMLALVEEIVEDYLQDFDTDPDKKAAKSVNSEDSLIKFYKQVLKNLKTSEVSSNTIGDIKKEVKKLFTTNNVKVS